MKEYVTPYTYNKLSGLIQKKKLLPIALTFCECGNFKNACRMLYGHIQNYLLCLEW